MISINKYGQNIDLSNVQELNGKKSYSLDNIDSSKTLLIKIPQGVKFVTTLQDEDLKVNFTDKEGNVFELILKNISDIFWTIEQIKRDNCTDMKSYSGPTQNKKQEVTTEQQVKKNVSLKPVKTVKPIKPSPKSSNDEWEAF